MSIVNVYLTFKGNSEEAFNFYRSVFGGDFSNVYRLKDMPPQEGMPPVPDSDKNKLMHISLPISKETTLMGADWVEAYGYPFLAGNNFSLSVTAETKAEADRLFKALSDGGQVTMPMENTFWGSYFGMLIDKFGINWMIDADAKGK